MKKLILAFAAISLLPTPALAHPEDEGNSWMRRFGFGLSRVEPPPRPSMSELARDAVIKLVSQAKLPATWSTATLDKLSARTKNGQSQYVVTFKNTAVRNKAKATLYVLLDSDGNFISANHRLS